MNKVVGQVNRSTHTDTPQQVAAARRSLCVGGLQRWASHG